MGFNQWLAAAVVRNSSLDKTSFRQLVEERVLDDKSAHYLQAIGFDAEKYLNNVTPEEVIEHAWYAALMGARLSPGPNAPHDFIVRDVLESSGLSIEARWQIMYGDSLASLAAGSGVRAFVEDVAPYLGDYVFGGWLSPVRSSELLRIVESTRANFDQPPPGLIDRYHAAGLADDSRLRQMFIEAFETQAAMLRGSVDRGLALRIAAPA